MVLLAIFRIQPDVCQNIAELDRIPAIRIFIVFIEGINGDCKLLIAFSVKTNGRGQGKII